MIKLATAIVGTEGSAPGLDLFCHGENLIKSPAE